MVDKNLKSANILIVDDQETNIELLRELLSIEGCLNIKSTTDPRKVIGLVKSFQPDLMLLDLHMPFLSGFDIMELLKTEKIIDINSEKYLPILVLTADVSPEIKLKALRAGAKDFLAKPFDMTEVSLRIKNLLETQYLYQKMGIQKAFFEAKIIEFLKFKDEWYR
ncbi:MAG: response regulator [Paludibacter sp.]